MSKQVVYFNATKQIDTVTIHYNKKLDGAYVEDVTHHIKEIASKMKGVNLKEPKEFDAIQVFVYPSKELFYKVFGGEIEKRFYARKRTTEDMYVVKDSEGNIHVVSPRGMNKAKVEDLKKILVMKVLGEYMAEKEKTSAERMLKAALMSKEEEKEQEETEELETEIEAEDIEQNIEEPEEDEEELTEKEMEELIEVQESIEAADEIEEDIQEDEKNEESNKEEVLPQNKSEAQRWLDIGWVAYVQGKLKKEKDIKKFAEHISKKGVKKLGGLSKGRLLDDYNYSEEYACAIVRYVIETYGTKKFIEYYNNPKDVEKIFGISKYNFDGNVKAFIYREYNAREMKMNLDEKEIEEITEIRFSKSGGADITKDTEIETPVKEITDNN